MSFDFLYRFILGDKKLRSIGVSNYNICHLEELLQKAIVSPAVNQ